MTHRSRYVENMAIRLIFGQSTGLKIPIWKKLKKRKMSAPEAKKAKLDQDDHAGSDQNKPMSHRPYIRLTI